MTYLYRKVNLKYGDLNLFADNMIIDEAKRIITARGKLKPKEQKGGVVITSLKEGTKLNADSIILYMDTYKYVSSGVTNEINIKR